ncbi:MAG: sulfite exporter TauE/SafE family protein [Bifidobacterium thermophilum]|nr:sulfite exporter TauE/SafE family protein [Bifidobacterium thermophilum]
MMHSGGSLVRRVVVLAMVGVLSGLMSGLFGIGGGTIIVPALVWLGLTQRHAVATSLAAIIPTAIAGVISYAQSGHVDWIAALLLACGTIVGAQLGSWLLSRLPEMVLRWAFAVFLVFVIVSQIVGTPSRDGTIHMTFLTGVLLVLLGVFVGTLSGLLGIGGGAIVVPALSLAFGASDLVARGTSLLMMIPNAIAGSVANVRRGLVNLRDGLIIGVVAACLTPAGTWIAGSISARMGANLFAIYLCVICVRSVWTAVKVTPALAKRLPHRESWR